MSHLSPETLARLVDEAPLPPEQEHLAACAACRAELEGMREDVQALATLPDMAPAPDAWDALEARLLDEGIMRRRTMLFPVNRYAQLAAALVLFVAGTAAGRLTASPDQPAGPVAALPVAQQPAPPAGGNPAVDFVALPDAPTQVAAAECVVQPSPERETVRPLAPRQSPMTFASNGGRPAPMATLDEAAAALRQSEELYLTALTRYAELTTQSDVNDPVARLAALQSIVMTTQAALSQTPSDPVINGTHLTALAQRDAALRQVAAANTPWH